MKTIQQTYHIHASVAEVWKALTDTTYIDGWGGGPAKMDEKIETKFSLWDGDIHGTNKEVVPMKKLIQEWYSGKWAEPSIVTFTLFEENDGTRLDFLHENVPDSAAKDIKEGWKLYYLGPLKKYLEKKFS